jgi:hypothetical protein
MRASLNILVASFSPHFAPTRPQQASIGAWARPPGGPGGLLGGCWGAAGRRALLAPIQPLPGAMGARVWQLLGGCWGAGRRQLVPARHCPRPRRAAAAPPRERARARAALRVGSRSARPPAAGPRSLRGPPAAGARAGAGRQVHAAAAASIRPPKPGAAGRVPCTSSPRARPPPIRPQTAPPAPTAAGAPPKAPKTGAPGSLLATPSITRVSRPARWRWRRASARHQAQELGWGEEGKGGGNRGVLSPGVGLKHCLHTAPCPSCRQERAGQRCWHLETQPPARVRSCLLTC